MPKVIVQYADQEYSVDLREGSNVIGRSSKCAIPLRDTNTSREHCEIQFKAGVATVVDKGSMNGTLVNGKKVTEQKLNPGDKIVIGQTSIYYETKPAGAAAGTPVAPPAPLQEIPTQPATGKPQTEVKKPAGGRDKPTARKGATAAALIKDYAKMGSDRGGLMGAAVGIVVGVGVLAVAAWALLGLKGGATEDDDPDNLVNKYGSCEVGTPTSVQGWGPARPYKSTIGLDGTRAHHGKGSLAIDKKAEPGDVIVEAATAEQFPLQKATKVEASAYARSEGFGGWCAIKINWYASVSGPLLLEEFSPGAQKPADWTFIRHEFTAPPGAGAFSVALCAVGGLGKIHFDEVKVYRREGGTPAKPAAFAPFTFTVSPAGVFTIALDDKRVLTNVQLALDSSKEGQTIQAIAEGVKVTTEEKKIEIKGKLAIPNLQTAQFELVIQAGDNEVKIGAKCSGDAMKLVDRMLLVMNVPRADRIAGLPAANEAGTPRVNVSTEGAEVVLEYPELQKVSADAGARGARRLVHAAPIDPGTGEAFIVVSLRRGGGLGPREDPIRDAKASEQKLAFGEALRILQEALKTARVPALREQLLGEVKRLEDAERKDWADIQARHFMAWISRRADLYASALENIAIYQRRWSNEAFGPKAAQLRQQIEEEAVTIVTASDEDRARRLLDQAKAYRDKGQRSVAISLCDLITTRYNGTKVAAEAQELLKSLRQ